MARAGAAVAAGGALPLLLLLLLAGAADAASSLLSIQVTPTTPLSSGVAFSSLPELDVQYEKDFGSFTAVNLVTFPLNAALSANGLAADYLDATTVTLVIRTQAGIELLRTAALPTAVASPSFTGFRISWNISDSNVASIQSNLVPYGAPTLVEVQRRAMFVPVPYKAVDFAPLVLTLAPVWDDDEPSKNAVAAFFGASSLDTSYSRPLQTEEFGEVSSLSGLPFAYANIEVDGVFDIAASRTTGLGLDAFKGWVWLTATTTTIIAGFIAESPLRSFDSNTTDINLVDYVAVMLPVDEIGLGALADGSGSISSTESEIVRNVELFTEEPGEACSPFKQSSRILSERPFFTIQRVTQPAIGSLGATPLISGTIGGVLGTLGTLGVGGISAATADYLHELLDFGGPIATGPNGPITTGPVDTAPVGPIFDSPTLGGGLGPYVNPAPTMQGRKGFDSGVQRTAINQFGRFEKARAAQVAVEKMGTGYSAPNGAAAANTAAGLDLLQTGTSAPESAAVAEALALLANVTSDLRDFYGVLAGRSPVDAAHPIPWEENPVDLFQAATVAGGHILEYRVRWRSYGYSLGDVAKTTTLAPRQKMAFSTIDWTRHQQETRDESQVQADQLLQQSDRSMQFLSQVQSQLHEWNVGHSTTTSASANAGGSLFGLIGSGTSVSGSASFAAQYGGRTMAASEQSDLRDSLRQFANSLRQTQSSVVVEATEDEVAAGTASTLHNVNFCHSITVMHHQILRHMRVSTEIVGAREVLFVPFVVSEFDYAKLAKYKRPISRYLRNGRHRRALAHVDDVAQNFRYSELPNLARSAMPLRVIRGTVLIKMTIARPADLPFGSIDPAGEPDAGAFIPTAWDRLRRLLPWSPLAAFGRITRTITQVAQLTQQQYDRIQAQRDVSFQREVAPRIARQFADKLQVRIGGTPGTLTSLEPVDFTLQSQYRYQGTVRAAFVWTPETTQRTRASLQTVQFLAGADLTTGSEAEITGFTLQYETEFFSRSLNRPRGPDTPLLSPTGVALGAGAVPSFGFPLTAFESANPRVEARALVDNLLEHVNDDQLHYHKAIWWSMDRDEVFMLLDGFNSYSTRGRSLASVVEPKPISIMGNSLVFRVAAGVFLGIGGHETADSLNDFYVDQRAKTEPMFLALPTNGLYARTLMDECNACEEHEGGLDWVLDKEKAREPDLPGQPSLLSRRKTGGDTSKSLLDPSSLAASIFNLPTVAGVGSIPASNLATLVGLVGRGFDDISGLAGNQKNTKQGIVSGYDFLKKAVDPEQALEAAKTIAALVASGGSAAPFLGMMDAAKGMVGSVFGGKKGGSGSDSAKLKSSSAAEDNAAPGQMQESLGAIQGAVTSGLLSKQQAKDLTKNGLAKMLNMELPTQTGGSTGGGGSSTGGNSGSSSSEKSTSQVATEAAAQAAAAGALRYFRQTSEDGETHISALTDDETPEIETSGGLSYNVTGAELDAAGPQLLEDGDGDEVCQATDLAAGWGICQCAFKFNVGKLFVDKSCKGAPMWVIPETGVSYTPVRSGSWISADGFAFQNAAAPGGFRTYKIDGSTCATITCSAGLTGWKVETCVNLLACLGGKSNVRQIDGQTVWPLRVPASGSQASPVF